MMIKWIIFKNSSPKHMFCAIILPPDMAAPPKSKAPNAGVSWPTIAVAATRAAPPDTTAKFTTSQRKRLDLHCQLKSFTSSAIVFTLSKSLKLLWRFTFSVWVQHCCGIPFILTFCYTKWYSTIQKTFSMLNI